jgi:hypothetical protein
MSTSSELFLTKCKGNVETLVEDISPYTESLVFKENRGGSRFFDLISARQKILNSLKTVMIELSPAALKIHIRTQFYHGVIFDTLEILSLWLLLQEKR